MESQNILVKTKIEVKIATVIHQHHAQCIVDMMFDAAKKRGTGISRRSAAFVAKKMQDGKAVIALDKAIVVGFCYINDWEDGQYVAHSGLIVNENYRGCGIAKKVKQEAFKLSRRKFPEATIFGITTSDAVMKVNTELGYRASTFADLPSSDAFWTGCKSCVNHDILQRTSKKHCLCTAMIFKPNSKKIKPNQTLGNTAPQKHFWV